MMRWLGMVLGLLSWQGTPADTLHIYSDRLLAETTSRWVTHFQNIHPDVAITYTATNTLTAVQALLNGQADLITIGRLLTPEEALIFQHHYRRPSVALPVGLDALGIFVHPSDPRKSTSLSELENLYAQIRRCHRGTAAPPTPPPKHLYGPNPANASHFHFQAKVLCGSPTRPETILLADDAAVITEVAGRKDSLGFASRALAIPAVRLLSLRPQPGQRAVLPSTEQLASGHYPLTYYLYLYLGQPKAAAFARTLFHPEGQAILGQRFVPLPESMRQQSLQRLESLRN